MKERSLVAFTLLAQMAVGAFVTLGVVHLWAARGTGIANRALLGIPALMLLAILASFLHLGAPRNAWRALANLRSSWLSREILFTLLFTAASGLFAGLQWFHWGSVATRDVLAWVAALLGLALIVSMANAYRLRTVPAWDTWATPASFFITAGLLGGLGAGAMLAFNAGIPLELRRTALQSITLGAVLLLSLELAIVSLRAVRLAAARGSALPAGAGVARQQGLIFKLRLALVLLAVAVAGIGLSPWAESAGIGGTTVAAFGLVLASEVLSRLLFYEVRLRHGL
jgi:anaerobic dimethyl sulfoxide reductase subunit C (anchor subunit)